MNRMPTSTLIRSLVVAASALPATIACVQAGDDPRPSGTLVYDARFPSATSTLLYRLDSAPDGTVWACGAIFRETGRIDDRPQGDWDAYLVRFHRDTPEDYQAYRWGTEENDRARGVVVDRCGNCYVVGQSGSNEPNTAFLRKYNRCGQLVFHRTLNFGPEIRPETLTIDRFGRLRMVGFARMDLPDLGRRYGCFVATYDSRGRRIGPARLIDPEGRTRAIFSNVLAAPNGDVIVSADTNGTVFGQQPDQFDFVVGRLDSRNRLRRGRPSQLPGNDTAPSTAFSKRGTLLLSGWVRYRQVVPNFSPFDWFDEEMLRVYGFEGYIAPDEFTEVNSTKQGTETLPLPTTAAEWDAIRNRVDHVIWEYDPNTLEPIASVVTGLPGGGRSITALPDGDVVVGGSGTFARLNPHDGSRSWRKPAPWSTLGTMRDGFGSVYVCGAKAVATPNGRRAEGYVLRVVE